MARSFNRKERLTAMSEINVTPLIDLAFALLIIFMITAPLLQQSIEIQLPIESTREQPPPDSKTLVLSIDQSGQFFWEGVPVNDGEMFDRLELASAETETPIVQVQADARIPYQRVVDLLDMIKANSLSKLKLETRSR